MNHYENLPKEIEEQIIEDRKAGLVNPYAFKNEDVVRRDNSRDCKNLLLRPAFVRDCEKIMHIPYYNRYNDKTQVFSLYKNDDITRRGLHVQLVSRIARNIGAALNLNTDLIEAIALGHDIGHTPFGHAGERKLSELYYATCGKYFNHNIQSARVLDYIFPQNISLQTLDGIICHNGEMEQEEYRPKPYNEFKEFDERMKQSYNIKDISGRLVPATLEACVVRVSDIIAYLGKDRQDAVRIGLIEDMSAFDKSVIGSINSEIINNMTVNIIKNSYGKPYISMDPDVYEAFSNGKRDNSSLIYRADDVNRVIDEQVYPMFERIFDRLLTDIKNGNRESVIYRHHIDYLAGITRYYKTVCSYEDSAPCDIVIDYMASMTDDYMIDLYDYLFPKNTNHVEYVGYFE